MDFRSIHCKKFYCRFCTCCTHRACKMLIRTAPHPAQLHRKPGNVLHTPESRAALGEEENTQKRRGFPRVQPQKSHPPCTAHHHQQPLLLPLLPACVLYSIQTWLSIKRQEMLWGLVFGFFFLSVVLEQSMAGKEVKFCWSQRWGWKEDTAMERKTTKLICFHPKHMKKSPFIFHKHIIN